jgi:hypothetical protein
MCDVPSIAVFCSESTECFPGMASKFFLYYYYYYLHFRVLLKPSKQETGNLSLLQPNGTNSRQENTDNNLPENAMLLGMCISYTH